MVVLFSFRLVRRQSFWRWARCSFVRLLQARTVCAASPRSSGQYAGIPGYGSLRVDEQSLASGSNGDSIDAEGAASEDDASIVAAPVGDAEDSTSKGAR